jgi:hypothetical protein
MNTSKHVLTKPHKKVGVPQMKGWTEEGKGERQRQRQRQRQRHLGKGKCKGKGKEGKGMLHLLCTGCLAAFAVCLAAFAVCLCAGLRPTR